MKTAETERRPSPAEQFRSDAWERIAAALSAPLQFSPDGKAVRK